MPGTWLGIDFSGNADSWRAGRPRNVWIAEAIGTPDRLCLHSLRPVQHLDGAGEPYNRLISRLEKKDFSAAGIDAPFSLPPAYLPAGGHPALLKLVDGLPLEPGRPFPRGSQLVGAVAAQTALQEAKPLRLTERRWSVNARSTLWAGPRGGAPFAAACLKLLARSRLDAWPWVTDGRGLLVEAFPSAQLKTWGLPHQRYADHRPDQVANRRKIAEALSGYLEYTPAHLGAMRDNADALDAVLCCFAAIAATEGRLGRAREDDGNSEGWIAVHA